MARGGRPRKRFTSRPPTRTRRRTKSSSVSKPPPSKFRAIILGAPPRPPKPKPIIAPIRARTGGLKGRPRKTKPKLVTVTLKGTGKRIKSGEGIVFSRGARGKIKARPTRVTVASPSGKGKTITVSSRSVLAKARGKKVLKLVTKRPKRIPLRERRSSFGSDFDIFRVSDVGGQARTFKQSTRTGRTGRKTRTGIPQTTTDVRISRPRKPKKPQPTFPKSPFVEGLFEVAGEVPLFIPRQIGKAVTQVTERISKKPLPKEDRAFGSDFDVLNFFG